MSPRTSPSNWSNRSIRQCPNNSSFASLTGVSRTAKTTYDSIRVWRIARRMSFIEVISYSRIAVSRTHCRLVRSTFVSFSSRTLFQSRLFLAFRFSSLGNSNRPTTTDIIQCRNHLRSTSHFHVQLYMWINGVLVFPCRGCLLAPNPLCMYSRK